MAGAWQCKPHPIGHQPHCWYEGLGVMATTYITASGHVPAQAHALLMLHDVI